MRDSARPGELGLPVCLPASPGRPSLTSLDLGRGPRVGRDGGSHCASPFQIFLPSQWRKGEEKRGESRHEKILRSLPFSSPPRELRLFWKPERPAPVPGCWGGGRVSMAPPARVASADACPAVTRVAGRLGHHFTCVQACASLRSEWS